MSEPSTESMAMPRRFWWFEDRPPGTVEGVLLVGCVLLVAPLALAAVFVEPRDRGGLLAIVYALPVLMVAPAVLAWRLLRCGSSRLPVVVATVGLVFVVGGALFDVVATVLHSPTLELEGNRIARTLLDSGHGLPFVYGYAFVAQGLFVGTVALLWLALLGHRDRIVEVIGPHESPWRFFKAATGGGQLTWRQWLLPLGPRDWPHPYPVVWTLVVAVVAGSIERWYVALDWFDLVPGLGPVEWAVLTLANVVAIVGWFAWLRRRCRE